jgi:hypothetical protein
MQSHLDPYGLQTSDNSEPLIVHQTGSSANLGHSPSTFIEEPKDSRQPAQEQNNTTSFIANHQDDDNDTDLTTDSDTYLGPTPPTPQMINLTHHQKRHTPQQKNDLICPRMSWFSTISWTHSNCHVNHQYHRLLLNKTGRQIFPLSEILSCSRTW